MCAAPRAVNAAPSRASFHGLPVRHTHSIAHTSTADRHIYRTRDGLTRACMRTPL